MIQEAIDPHHGKVVPSGVQQNPEVLNVGFEVDLVTTIRGLHQGVSTGDVSVISVFRSCLLVVLSKRWFLVSVLPFHFGYCISSFNCRFVYDGSMRNSSYVFCNAVSLVVKPDSLREVDRIALLLGFRLTKGTQFG